jgi:DNA invertase Pin-like site-specific DNA recombinase
MISVLSAVAEIERENILVQTMEGRRQKAREGKWNGGFAPYGYKLVDGELQVAEDEAPIIRLIYDKFVNTTMGIGAIVTAPRYGKEVFCGEIAKLVLKQNKCSAMSQFLEICTGGRIMGKD